MLGTYDQLLSSEDFLACHIYCDTGHPFIVVISGNHEAQTHSRAFGSVADTTCFNDLGLSRLRFEHPAFHLWGERSNRLRHHRG